MDIVAGGWLLEDPVHSSFVCLLDAAVVPAIELSLHIVNARLEGGEFMKRSALDFMGDPVRQHVQEHLAKNRFWNILALVVLGYEPLSQVSLELLLGGHVGKLMKFLMCPMVV